MVAVSFLSTLFLALAVFAKPVEQRDASLPQLSFAKLVRGGDVVNLDRQRVDHIKGIDTFGPGSGKSSPADNRAVTYVATVGVGSPPTNCKPLQRLVADYKFLTAFHRWPYHWHGKVSESVRLSCTAQMIFHSSNTWIGAGKPYVKTYTSHETSSSLVSGLEFVYTLLFVCWVGSIVSYIWSSRCQRQVFVEHHQTRI